MSVGDIDTPAKRSRLKARKNPYWLGISGGRGGLSLGFRKTIRGNGVWVAKIVVDGQRLEERIGTPDGDNAAPGSLSFPSAVEATIVWGKRQAASVAIQADNAAIRKIPTVQIAVETYVEMRKARADRSGSEGSLKLHVLGDKEFASLKLSGLEAQNILDWRGRLSSQLVPSSKNRLLNDLRAALNAAAAKYRRQMPAHILAEIKLGTKAEAITSSPRRQLLTDEQVRAVIDAAFEIDPSGDFGRLVLLAAVTGARFSQLAALTILDFQVSNMRLMIPSSRKGKSREPGARAAVPISVDVMDRILPAVAGRSAHEPLLLRWSYRKTGGPGNWTKNCRRAWGRASEIGDLWSETIERTGVPSNTVMYALRHSSIVRGLVQNLPVRLVATLHDTSIEMIEKHYAAFIIDMTEDMARQKLIALEVPKRLEAAE